MDVAGTIELVARILGEGGWRGAVAAAQVPLVAALKAAGYRTMYKSSGFSNHRHEDPR